MITVGLAHTAPARARLPRPATPRVFWLHLRTCPIRYALAVLVVGDIAVVLGRDQHWIGVWPQTGAAALVPAYLLGVVGAGAAAWAASAPARHRLDEQLAAARVSPAVITAHRLAATATVLLIPYLCGQLVAFAATARTFPPGVHLWLGYVVLGIFVILLATALGWACGSLFPPVFAALVAALAFLFLAALLDRVGFVVISGYPEFAVGPLPLALRLAAVLVLLSVLVLLPTAHGTSRPGRGRAALLIPAALPLVAVLVLTDAVTERAPPGDRVACVPGRSTLCVWPEHEKYLPQLRDLNARVDRLPAAFVPPPRINEAGIQRTRYIGPDGREHHGYEIGPPAFYILEGSPWSYAGDIATAITASTFDYTDARSCRWQQLTPADTARIWAVDAWLEAYLVGQGSPDSHTDAPADMRAAWSKGRSLAGGPSRAEQFRWADREVRDLRGRYCQP